MEEALHRYNLLINGKFDDPTSSMISDYISDLIGNIANQFQPFILFVIQGIPNSNRILNLSSSSSSSSSSSVTAFGTSNNSSCCSCSDDNNNNNLENHHQKKKLLSVNLADYIREELLQPLNSQLVVLSKYMNYFLFVYLLSILKQDVAFRKLLAIVSSSAALLSRTIKISVSAYLSPKIPSSSAFSF